MPQIPRAANTVEPENIPQAGQQIQATPAAFGSGQGLSNFGAGLERAADQVQATQQYIQGLHQEAQAKQAYVGFTNDALVVGFDPKKGFMSKQGADALDAYPSIGPTLEGIYKKYRAALPPAAQRMFDDVATRRMEYMKESFARHADQEGKRYRNDQSEASIQAEENMGASFYNDDEAFDGHLKAARFLALQQAIDNGASPEAQEQAQMQVSGRMWSSRIEAARKADLAGAQKMFDEHADEIPAAHRATIQRTLEAQQITAMNQAIALEARRDRLAERDRKRGQAVIAGNLMAQALAGNPPSAADVAKGLQTGAISTSGARAVMATLRGGGVDDTQTVFEMTRRAHAHADMSEAEQGKDTFSDDIQDAVANGLLTPKTALGIQKQAYTQASKQEKDVTTQWYATLKTTFNGNAVESPLYDMGNETKAQLARKWSQVQNEWNNSTIKDPRQRYEDIVQRYWTDPHPPPTMRLPRYAPATGIQTAEDVAAAAEATKAAQAAGKLTQSQADDEARLLHDYLDFFQNTAGRPQAAAKQKPAAAAGGKGVEK